MLLINIRVNTEFVALTPATPVVSHSNQRRTRKTPTLYCIKDATAAERGTGVSRPEVSRQGMSRPVGSRL